MTTHTDAPADDLVKRLEARTVQRLAQNWRKGLKCPECDADADRPKCMWDCGPSCPRLDPHAYDFSPYTSHPDPLSHEAAARIRSLEEQRDEAVGLLTEALKYLPNVERICSRIGAFLNSLKGKDHE